jgi:uncharacterized membrane protein SpoIIM required for sporulation
MRYAIRRISLRSALTFGLLLGWLAALLPAAGLATLLIWLIQGVNRAIGQVETYEISVFGQQIATIDTLALLGLSDEASRVAELAGGGLTLFATLTLLFTLVGGVLVAASAALVCLGYNLLARLTGGLAVELREIG